LHFYNDFPFPIAKRRKGKTKIDECPYCGEPHEHAPTLGYRNAHCRDGDYFKEIEIKGYKISQSNGYFIEEY
jgi:hypothetical protein